MILIQSLILIHVSVLPFYCDRFLLQCRTKNDALKEMNTLALANFPVPGDPNFPLNSFYEKAKDRAEEGRCITAEGGSGTLTSKAMSSYLILLSKGCISSVAICLSLSVCLCICPSVGLDRCGCYLCVCWSFFPSLHLFVCHWICQYTVAVDSQP